jgi:hypothetical protein
MQHPAVSSSISVHDNLLYSYSVNCENRRIVLHTRFPTDSPTEYTDVIFTGVVAHHFEHVLSGNILFDVTEIPLRDLVTGSAVLFAAGKPYGWPDGIEYRDAEDLIGILEGRGAHGFEISSSYGMSGWVIAGSTERKARARRAMLPAGVRIHPETLHGVDDIDD